MNDQSPKFDLELLEDFRFEVNGDISIIPEERVG
jgi:hypothetical protein